MITGPYPHGVQQTHRDIPLEFSFVSKDSDRWTNFSKSENVNDRRMKRTESGSTKSASFSNPYNPTDNTNSFDTASLLNQFENRDPLYSNTSHINMVHTPINNRGTSGHENDLLNQVPRRFSRFILDQQNSHVAHKMDNLSLDSISMYSLDAESNNNTDNSTIPNLKQWPDQSNVNPRRHSTTDTVSQTTIFSTRPAKKPLFNKLLSKSKSNSNLTRTKAIRFKQGSWYYRLKVRMKRIAKKLKALRFNNFTVASKRTGSVKRSKSKGNKLKRKYRKNPQNAAVKRLTSKEISVPYSNPQLGQGEIEKVETLDASLKHQAGANIEPPNANNMKLNQMSDYIDEQQDSYINSMYTKTKSSSINYDNNFVDKKDVRHNYNSVSDIEEVPPTPPPHLEHNNFSAVQGEEANNVMCIWKRYLRHVISQRIQLRKEIVFFQELTASQGAKFTVNDVMDQETSDHDKFSADEYASESEGTHGTETVSGSDVGTELSDIVDSPTQEFNNAYNRRSVLGEMLDYDSSDNELVSSSVYSNSSHDSTIRYQEFIRSASSTASSDIGIGKRYGTIIRRNPTISRNRSIQRPNKKSASCLVHPMKRSQGFQEGLNEVK